MAAEAGKARRGRGRGGSPTGQPVDEAERARRSSPAPAPSTSRRRRVPQARQDRASGRTHVRRICVARHRVAGRGTKPPHQPGLPSPPRPCAAGGWGFQRSMATARPIPGGWSPRLPRMSQEPSTRRSSPRTASVSGRSSSRRNALAARSTPPREPANSRRPRSSDRASVRCGSPPHHGRGQGHATACWREFRTGVGRMPVVGGRGHGPGGRRRGRRRDGDPHAPGRHPLLPRRPSGRTVCCPRRHRSSCDETAVEYRIPLRRRRRRPPTGRGTWTRTDDLPDHHRPWDRLPSRSGARRPCPPGARGG
jgi:hypothetical protein